MIRICWKIFIRGFRWGKKWKLHIGGERGGDERQKESNEKERRREERCHSWQGGEPSNKYSTYSQCAEINDVISAWIDVCTVPLKGALSINYLTIPPPKKCTHTHTEIHTVAPQMHTNPHTPKPSQLVRMKMYGCKVSVSHDRYVNVFLQLSSPITVQMVGGGREEINLLR